jgi:hypothetical protein
MQVAGASLDAWRRVASRYQELTCPLCGCSYDLTDEGTAIGKVDRQVCEYRRSLS